MTMVEERRVPLAELQRFVVEVLASVGVPDDEARIVADVLTSADVRGVDSHGVARLSRYVECIESGKIARRAEIKVLSAWPAIARLDGGGGMGQVVGYRAMQRCLDMAERAGMASVSVTHSNHYGIAGYYAMMALPRGMIGISLTNASPTAVPTFGRQRMLGTNPLAMAVPAGNERPWVIDMATTAIPVGKLEIAMRHGRQLQYGVALDGAGKVTTDPWVARREGALLPLGGPAETAGHKGYGLSVLVDILSGVLSGSGYSSTLRGGWGVSPIGHFFAAIRVDAVRPLAEFQAMMDQMIRDLRESPKALGHERILIHGEPEFEAEEARRRDGIPLVAPVYEDLCKLAARLGVPAPRLLA